MDLSIIIVNWNSVDYLRECVRSIKECTPDIGYEVIVIDNASTRDDVSAIVRSVPGVKLIASTANLGFAGANNLGFAHSTGADVLFLNPDTEIIGSAIGEMLEQLHRLPDAGILGGRLLNTDLSVQLSAIGRRPTILSQALDAELFLKRWPQCSLWGIGPLFSQETAPVAVDLISGACMLMQREVFERVGGFSEEYFMYAEDVDLCYKVSAASHQNYFVGTATIIHHGGKSSSRQPVSHWQTTMKNRAMRYYFRKTRGTLYEFVYRFAMIGAAVFRLALLGLLALAGKQQALRNSREKWAAVLKCMWESSSGYGTMRPAPVSAPSVIVVPADSVREKAER